MTPARLASLCWLGAAGVALSILHPALQGPTHFPTSLATVPLGVAGGLFALGLGVRWGAVESGWWAALSAIGFGALLPLIDAGTIVHYQHLRSPAAFPAMVPAWVLVLLALQGVAVLWGLGARRKLLGDWLRGALRPWQLVLLLLLVVLFSATVSREVPAYAVEVVVAGAFHLLALANVLLAAATLPTTVATRLSTWSDALLGPPADPAQPADGGLDRFAWLTALAVTLVTACLAVVVYQRHPHLQDEVVYLYQARYFARGQLAMANPPVPEAFGLYLMDVGRTGWYAVTQPGWGAILALGAAVGAGWLVNPVLSGLTVLAGYLLLLHLFDRRTARLATLLYALSPWQLFLGMSYMNHTATLLCALLAALGVVWTRRTGHAGWAWLGGLALGMVFLLRQLDAMAIAVPLGLWSLGLGGKRIPLLGTAGLVLGSMLVSAAVFPYNAYFTGTPRTFPIMAYNDSLYGKGANDYGFGPNRGMGWPLDPFPGHGHRDAIINANLNATAIDVELSGWAIGSLAPLFLFGLAGRWTRGDRLLLVIAGTVFGAYYLNYFSGGPDFGGRYWYLMIVPLVAYAARGLDTLARRSTREPALAADRRGRTLLLTGVLCLGALTAFVPWRGFDKYHDYLGMNAGIPRLAREHQFGRSLVLVRGREMPDYASAAIYNPLDLTADAPIYAFEKTAELRARLLAAYPDRPVWVLEGPSLAGGNYRVLAGPLTAEQAAALPPPPTP